MVAVSGGVDSVVLLHLLVQKYVSPVTSHQSPVIGKHTANDRRQTTINKPYRFVAAHYDHGIREDSHNDREFVQKIADKYGVPCVFDMGKLGSNASEETARDARYKFLNKVKKITAANAIITAHHQDDQIETIIFNLLRGTGRKGLSSLTDRKGIIRPLLGVSKKEIITYANKHNIKWREDPTNTDLKYRRNYIRAKIVSKISTEQRKDIIAIINKATLTNKKIDDQIAKMLQFIETDKELDRALFTALPHKIAAEIVAGWLRSHGIRDFDKRIIERLTTTAKTYPAGKIIDINKRYIVKVTLKSLALQERDR